MLLPIRSKNPPESLPIVTVALITLNVAMYAATSNGLEIKESALRKLAITSNTFDPLHILTSMFLHADILHILGNMFFLYLFGFAVEGRMKSVKFVIMYLLSGVAGAVLHQVMIGQLHPDQPSLGASGAIMGVMGAALYMFPHSKVTVFYGWSFRFGTFDCPMWGVAIYYLGFDILLASLGAPDGTAHFAHIGGAAAGLILAFTMRIKRDSAEASDAKASLSETKDLTTLSRLELEALHAAKPDDTSVVINWAYRSLRDPGGVRPNCLAAFQRLLPKMMAEQEPGPVAYCLTMLPLPDTAVPLVYYATLATKLEKAGEFQSAMQMYQIIGKNLRATPADLESALFRMGMLYESAFGNFAAAQNCYRELLRQYPMGPFAESSRVRLAHVTQRGLTPSV